MHERMEALWARLPEVIRERDINTQLKRWLQGARVKLDEMGDLIDYMEYNEETGSSALIDPLLMEDGWIPWNKMIRGIPQQGIPNSVSRTHLSGPAFLRGTDGSMAEVLRYYLTGSKSVKIYKRSNDVDPLGTAGPWEVCVVVKADEWVGVVPPDQVIIEAKCKPAGVKLSYRLVDGTTWETIEATYPFWSDWEAAGPWVNITG